MKILRRNFTNCLEEKKLTHWWEGRQPKGGVGLWQGEKCYTPLSD
jgi:hypothetical protein